MTLREIESERDAFANSLLAQFRNELEGIVGAARAWLLFELQRRLTVDADGAIRRGVANQKVLRNLDALFLEGLNRAGYDGLLREFVGQFPGGLKFFEQTVEAIGAQLKEPLVMPTFGAKDLQVLTDQAVGSRMSLEAVAESIAALTKQRVLLSVGGLTFAELVNSIASMLDRTIPQSVGIADTALATHYRTITDQGFQLIEDDSPGAKIRYRFVGPDDKLTRPFCRKLVESGKSYTRAQIDRMNNGQIPNCLISGGGWNCRHVWVIDAKSSNLSGSRRR